MRNNSVIIPLIIAVLIVSGYSIRWRYQTHSYPTSVQLTNRLPRLKKKPFLLFSLILDREIYSSTKYGNPPQFAIWLSDSAGSKIQTVYVTKKFAKGKWDGKTSCPTCLPHYLRESIKDPHINNSPSNQHPLPDAVTAATPIDTLSWKIDLFNEDLIHFLIEINVSGDYNSTFENQLSYSGLDDGGNGQPSLVYRGNVPAVQEPVIHHYEFIGRTDQFIKTDSLINSREDITTADHLIKAMTVTFISESR